MSQSLMNVTVQQRQRRSAATVVRQQKQAAGKKKHVLTRHTEKQTDTKGERTKKIEERTSARDRDTTQKIPSKKKKRGGGGPKRNLNLVINFNTSKHLKYNHVVRIQQTSKQMSRTPT
jgi:hypothetical protein